MVRATQVPGNLEPLITPDTIISKSSGANWSGGGGGQQVYSSTLLPSCVLVYLCWWDGRCTVLLCCTGVLVYSCTSDSGVDGIMYSLVNLCTCVQSTASVPLVLPRVQSVHQEYSEAISA